MLRTFLIGLTTALMFYVLALRAQGLHAAPRPPAQAAGIPPGESAAPDGYATIPAWLGETRAPHPAKNSEYTVETVAEGLAGGFSFNFLPDGRMLVAERAGRLKLVGQDGKITQLEGLPSVDARPGTLRGAA